MPLNVTRESVVATGGVDQSTITRSFTVTNKRGRVLLVAIHTKNGTVINSVTYGAKPLTKIKSHTYDGERHEMWALKTPPVGTENVVITLAATEGFTDAMIGHYSNVNLAKFPDASNVNSNTSNSSLATTVTTQSKDCLVVAHINIWSGITSTSAISGVTKILESIVDIWLERNSAQATPGGVAIGAQNFDGTGQNMIIGVSLPPLRSTGIFATG